MKQTFLFLLIAILFFTSFSYDSNFVEISSVTDKGYEYRTCFMDRGGSGNRIKAKYFAGKGDDGVTVSQRYLEWSKGKNVIIVSSGGFMTDMNPYLAKPDGFTIDNGRVINTALASFDALVIVYATGGIAVTNLKKGDLTLQGGGITPNRKFDIRNNYIDRTDFISWAESEKATVFQTQLLVYKNEITCRDIKESEAKKRFLAERRFLAVGKDKNTGNLCHVILNLPENQTKLYEGTLRAQKFLSDSRDMDITFMINLDTGGQDVCFLYNKDASVNELIKGKESINKAINLLAYYYE